MTIKKQKKGPGIKEDIFERVVEFWVVQQRTDESGDTGTCCIAKFHSYDMAEAFALAYKGEENYFGWCDPVHIRKQFVDKRATI